MYPIKLEAYFTGFGSKADGSASLRFATQELKPEDFVVLSTALNKFGWLIFKDNPISIEELPTEQAEDKNKTPSKRLRATLFVLWKQEGEHGDFENFYRERMEKIISMVKTKLD